MKVSRLPIVDALEHVRAYSPIVTRPSNVSYRASPNMTRQYSDDETGRSIVDRSVKKNRMFVHYLLVCVTFREGECNMRTNCWTISDIDSFILHNTGKIAHDAEGMKWRFSISPSPCKKKKAASKPFQPKNICITFHTLCCSPPLLLFPFQPIQLGYVGDPANLSQSHTLR